jgi:hypothetical protein
MKAERFWRKGKKGGSLVEASTSKSEKPAITQLHAIDMAYSLTNELLFELFVVKLLRRHENIGKVLHFPSLGPFANYLSQSNVLRTCSSCVSFGIPFRALFTWGQVGQS